MDAGMNENEHWLELIQAELDGELSGPQRAELHRALLADPALRALRDELAATCRALDAVEAEPAPVGLRQAVMAALPARPRSLRSSRVTGHASMMRLAAAFAGGILVSALAFQFGGAVTGRGGQLSGTIADVEVDPSRLDVRTPLVGGSIFLDDVDGTYVVHARLAATRPITVVARHADQEARLTGFVADAVSGSGERSAGFAIPATSDPSVDVEVLDPVSGTVLQRGTIRAAGSR
jgi:anti-sigma factor RsiW